MTNIKRSFQEICAKTDEQEKYLGDIEDTSSNNEQCDSKNFSKNTYVIVRYESDQKWDFFHLQKWITKGFVKKKNNPQEFTIKKEKG